MQEISLNSLKSQLDLVKAHMKQTSTKEITVVDYISRDEGMCTATYFIGQKKDFQSPFEAFVILYDYKFHFFEGWSLENSSDEDIENVVDILWLIPELEKFCFRELSAFDIYEATAWIIKSIEEKIEKKKDIDPYKEYAYLDQCGSNGYPNHRGICVNKKLVTSDGFKLPVADKILSGVGLSLEWNWIEIFYETTDEYIWFYWGTSA